MVECQVDHAVRLGRSLSQAVEILHVAMLRLSARRSERRGTSIRPVSAPTHCVLPESTPVPRAEPMNPVAPVTKICEMLFPLRDANKKPIGTSAPGRALVLSELSLVRGA